MGCDVQRPVLFNVVTHGTGNKDHVDIRDVVQFTGARLAHANHGKSGCGEFVGGKWRRGAGRHERRLEGCPGKVRQGGGHRVHNGVGVVGAGIPLDQLSQKRAVRHADIAFGIRGFDRHRDQMVGVVRGRGRKV